MWQTLIEYGKNASCEWPILEQFMGECLLRLAMQVQASIQMIKSLQTKQHKTNQKHHKNPFKPADLMQILQFTSAQMVQFWWSKCVSLTQNWLELANLFMGILWCLISQYFLIGYHYNFLHYNEQGQGSRSFSRSFRGQSKHYSHYITLVVRGAPLNIPTHPNIHES